MKKLLLRQLIPILLLAVLFSSCPLDDPVEEEESASRVYAPVVTMNPNRVYNNAPIQITLSVVTPPDADIYYTLNGSTPTASSTHYTGPFNLAAGNSTNPANRGRGYISLKVIGIKGELKSSVTTRDFQIFDTQPAIGTYTGPANGTGGPGYHDGTIGVNLILADGLVTAVTFDNDVGDKAEYPEYWGPATTYAGGFIPLMNHWDIDPVISGASYSGEAIRKAAKEAFESVP